LIRTLNAALLAAAGLAGSLVVPGQAHAAALIPLTPSQVNAEFAAVILATEKAAAQGYTSRITGTDLTRKTTTVHLLQRADLTHGVSQTIGRLGDENLGWYVVKGAHYELLDPASRTALKHAGKPGVTFEVVKDPATTPPTVYDLVKDVQNSLGSTGVTKVDDGATATYTATTKSVTTVVTTVDGVYTGQVQTETPAAVQYRTEMTYGPQTVTLPAPATVASSAAVARAVAHYQAKRTLTTIGEDVVYTATPNTKGDITAAALRKAAKNAVKRYNSGLGEKFATVTPVRGGVALHAVSSKTKKKVTVTVTVNGKGAVTVK
jgi:hypothetical protein